MATGAEPEARPSLTGLSPPVMGCLCASSWDRVLAWKPGYPRKSSLQWVARGQHPRAKKPGESWSTLEMAGAEPSRRITLSCRTCAMGGEEAEGPQGSGLHLPGADQGFSHVEK